MSFKSSLFSRASLDFIENVHDITVEYLVNKEAADKLDPLTCLLLFKLSQKK